jgi:hypothetical protein
MLTYADVCIAGEARFSSNGRVLEGSIRGVRGQGLVPTVYCSGVGTRFTCTIIPGVHNPTLPKRPPRLQMGGVSRSGGGDGVGNEEEARKVAEIEWFGCQEGGERGGAGGVLGGVGERRIVSNNEKEMEGRLTLLQGTLRGCY